MNKQILLPLAAMLIASPVWARQHHGSISLSATSLSFNGSTGNASSQPLTITSTGSRAVTIDKLSYSNSAFSGSASVPATLARGQSLAIRIAAQPAATAESGKLTITTSIGTFAVSLSETATAASHKVSLTWRAPSSSSDPVHSYEVVRSGAGSSQFSIVGTTPSASTGYTDSSVASGKTYVYEVRSVDQSGNASSPSNAVTLTIP